MPCCSTRRRRQNWASDGDQSPRRAATATDTCTRRLTRQMYAQCELQKSEHFSNFYDNFGNCIPIWVILSPLLRNIHRFNFIAPLPGCSPKKWGRLKDVRGTPVAETKPKYKKHYWWVPSVEKMGETAHASPLHYTLDHCNTRAIHSKRWRASRLSPFLANVNSSSCSLYVIVRPSVVCRLSVVCNVRAPYSDNWNFRQCFYAIGYLAHLLTYR